MRESWLLCSSDQNMCNLYIWGTLWDKVYSNNPCTEDGVENIQDVKKVKQSRYRPGVAQRVPGS
jgi:hypothetical protein